MRWRMARGGDQHPKRARAFPRLAFVYSHLASAKQDSPVDSSARTRRGYRSRPQAAGEGSAGGGRELEENSGGGLAACGVRVRRRARGGFVRRFGIREMVGAAGAGEGQRETAGADWRGFRRAAAGETGVIREAHVGDG